MRISALEASNREAVSALEAKTASTDKLAEDLAAQQQRTVALKLEISTIEEKAQTLENSVASSKFKEQTLTQELDLLKRNNEWHEQELKARSAEHTKFRKERNARISELQRMNEEASTNIDALKRTETSLRQQVDGLTLKAENAFAKIQQLEGQAADAERNFSVELSSANRLAELQRQSADSARARLLELQDSIESIKDSAAAEIGQLQAEIETERSDKEASEAKLAQLEQEVERLQDSVAVASVPGTPARSFMGNLLSTPRRPSSSHQMTPGSARQKGNLSFTQLVSEVSTLRSDLETERRRNTALTAQLDELIQDLESRGPEQAESRQERERIEAEVVEMSSLLDQATSDRDEAIHNLKESEGRISTFETESGVLRQQLRDLSAQVKLLLVEMQAREQGMDSLDAAGQAQLQMLINNNDDDQDADQTSAGALITQRLLLFKNVAELQEQNVQLLRLNRGLAEKMEGDATKAREAQEADALREVEELRSRMHRYQDEIKNMTAQADGIMRERDMFRRMLSHRGPLAGNANLQAMFAQSVDGRSEPPATPNGHTNGGMPQTPRSKQDSDYAKLVKDLQSHLDATRSEANISHNTLKEQLTSLTKEKNDSQSDASRASGQLALANERYEMLQTNYRMVQSENGELQKRSQKLSENAAVQDLRTQQVAEELIEARALAESMRTESANSKAERDLWKRVEARLTEDNVALRDDKSRVNKMYASLQNLQNERELADSEGKRKLQARIEFLEGELDGLRKKLEAEVDDNKKASQRRTYELDQNRTRIDELLAGHAAAREELVSAKTLKQQAESRVEELRVELHSAQERIETLQPRSTSVGADNDGVDGSNGEAGADAEQTLQTELSDAKRDLESAQNELQKAFAEVEQYKSISQATEEELQSLVETNDQYREEMDAILAEKEAMVAQLEGRVEDINSELTTTNKQLSELRLQHDETSKHIELQKSELELEITRLRDESERQTETAKLCQEDLKAQAEIAQQAQQSYEDELLKHAEAAKSLHAVRHEYKTLRNEVAAIKAEAEAATITLSQNEESWAESRERYERELSEVKVGREELQSQNKLLHEQLESVGSQVAALQEQRGAVVPDQEQQSSADQGLASLQEVIKYLRREKEIVDVQYDMSVQESKRLRQQLDYVQGQLDESRQKLDEERRVQADKENTTSNHTQLLQTINELNVYRESSATLRQEARQAQSQLQEKLKDLETVTAQLLPLQAQLRQLEDELQTKGDELKLLEEDRDMWRERTQNIISKYDRVDPAELESLKTQISTLQAERDELVAKRDEMQEQIDQIPSQIQGVKDSAEQDWQDKRAKLIEQAKARSREQAAKLRDSERELASMKDERDRVAQQLSEAQNSIQAANLEREQATLSAGQQVDMGGVQQEDGQIEESAEATTEDANAVTALTSRAEGAESNLEAMSTRVSELSQELDSAQARIVELEEQVVSYVSSSKLQLLTSQATQQEQIETAGNAVGAPPETTNEFTDTNGVESIKAELTAAQQELEILRAATATVNTDPEPGSAVPQGESADNVTARVAAEVDKIKQQLDVQHEERMAALEKSTSERINSMKNQLREKLRESRDKAREDVRAELIEEHTQVIVKLKEEHQSHIDQLTKAHEETVQRLQSEAEAIKTAGAQLEPAIVPADESKAETVVKTEPQPIDFSTLEMTEAQARELATKNQTIRALLSKNIQSRVQKETSRCAAEHEEALQAKIAELTEIHDKALAANTTAANEAKEQAVTKAVAMEGMKQKAKLGMAEGSARSAKAKLEVVEIAAKTTPQKPVVEVWEAAKVAKPTAAPAATGTPLKAASTPIEPKAAVQTIAQPAAPVTEPATAAVPALPSQEQLAARQARFGAPSVIPAAAQPATAGSFGKPSLTAPGSTPNIAATSASTLAAGSAPVPAAASTPQPRGGGVPRGIPRAGGSMLPRGGAGRGAARGGLPQPAGVQASTAAGRGASALPRGGGMLRGPAIRGRGRGGFAAVGSAAGASDGQGLDAAAPQFTPGGAEQSVGAKRPLQDGGAAAQGDEKRIRGPGDGGA